MVGELLRSLLQAYQVAIGPLASYLRRMDVAAQELELDEKLLDHAFGRADTESQLRFIHDGLSRAASWYKTQLADRLMTTDPELRQLLVELGEIDAAKLWRTEAVMAALKIPLTLKEPDYVEPVVPSRGGDIREPTRTTEWRPRLVDDVRRPNWTGRNPRRGAEGEGQAGQGERGSSRTGPDTQDRRKSRRSPEGNPSGESKPRGRGPQRSDPRE
jgi:hypothetical protein